MPVVVLPFLKSPYHISYFIFKTRFVFLELQVRYTTHGSIDHTKIKTEIHAPELSVLTIQTIWVNPLYCGK